MFKLSMIEQDIRIISLGFFLNTKTTINKMV
jgi:hypothetical protein